MYTNYLVTGAAGFLGRTVVSLLSRRAAHIRALVMKNDRFAKELPEGVEIFYGDICDEQSLKQFFANAGTGTCVIHCAGIVSVASRPGEQIYRVNVGGTNNILRYCEKHEVGRLIYVSSVHAIPEKAKGICIAEAKAFSPDLVKGYYGKSKAIATSLVFEAAERGLKVNVVFPSGMIGPGDLGKGSMTSMLLSFLKGRMPFAVKGGYDFVDVRDVAQGIIFCAELASPGKGYILSGHRASIRDILEIAGQKASVNRKCIFLPLILARAAAPAYEKICLKKGLPLYFTPYSISILGSGDCFTWKAAADAFGYSPRPLENSIHDMILYF